MESTCVTHNEVNIFVQIETNLRVAWGPGSLSGNNSRGAETEDVSIKGVDVNPNCRIYTEISTISANFEIMGNNVQASQCYCPSIVK